jgi:hypothetical protein
VYAGFWTGILGDWIGLGPIGGIWVGLRGEKMGTADMLRSAVLHGVVGESGWELR